MTITPTPDGAPSPNAAPATTDAATSEAPGQASARTAAQEAALDELLDGTGYSDADYLSPEEAEKAYREARKAVAAQRRARA